MDNIVIKNGKEYLSKRIISAVGWECERLLNKLAPISRRVLGPEHPTTKDIEFGQKLNRSKMRTDDSINKYEAGGYSDEEEKYVVIRGPLPNPRIWDEEQIMTVAINDIIYLPGTAVICHGLKNAAHLNGKIGDIRSRDNSTVDVLWCALRTRV